MICERFNNFLKRLARLRPITMATHKKILTGTLIIRSAEMARVHEQSLVEATKYARAIVDHAMKTSYERLRDGHGDRFALRIEFDPRLLGAGYASREEMRFVGDMTGQRVAAEISSYKFIQKAHDLEAEIYGRR